MTITQRDVDEALKGFDPRFRYIYDCSCGRANPRRVFAVETEAKAAAKRHLTYCLKTWRLAKGERRYTTIKRVPWS